MACKMAVLRSVLPPRRLGRTGRVAIRASGGFGSATRREKERKKVELEEESITGGSGLEEYFLFARQIKSDAKDEGQGGADNDRGEWKALGDISVTAGSDVAAAIRTRRKEVEAASKKRLPKKSRVELGYRLQRGPAPDDGEGIGIKVLTSESDTTEESVPSRLRFLEFDSKAESPAKTKRRGGKGGGASWSSVPSRSNRTSGAAGEYGQR